MVSTLIRGVAALALFIGLSRPASATEPAATDVVKHYVALAEASYQEAYAGAKALQKAVDAFLAKPSEVTLAAARAAWIAARPSYLQTEAFRFTNPVVDEWEGKVNSWPLDEGLIDYVDGPSDGSENPLANANVVASKSVQVVGKAIDVVNIDADLLERLQEAGGIKSNVATGYHAVEFLLWGQDLHGTEPGAGERPYTDYDLQHCSHGNCERRATYLKVATNLLVKDLAWIVAQWQPDGAASRHIQSLPPAEAVVAIFSGLASLSYGELAGERTKLALLLHDPEEEHDCFSDNTHNSHYYDALGIENVYLGRLKRADGTILQGPSVSDLVRARAKATDDDVRKAVALTVARMKVMVDKARTGATFDTLIAEGNTEGNRIVQSAIDALIAQTSAFRRAAVALNIKQLKVQDSDSLSNPGKVGK
ncbi:MAG: imelysin family protein [Hyphomicrobiaceae bacterium]